MTDAPRPPRPLASVDLSDEGMVAARVLRSYGLRIDTEVEVELLVTGGGRAHGSTMPRLVEGAVASATLNVLILEAATPAVVYRIPWQAIALIRNTHHHPANS